MNDLNEINEEEVLLNNFCSGFESLLNTKHDAYQLVGNEGVCYWLMRGSELETRAGTENFLVDGIKKFWDMIINSLKAVKKFFFGEKSKEVDKAEKELTKSDAPIFSIEPKGETNVNPYWELINKGVNDTISEAERVLKRIDAFSNNEMGYFKDISLDLTGYEKGSSSSFMWLGQLIDEATDLIYSYKKFKSAINDEGDFWREENRYVDAKKFRDLFIKLNTHRSVFKKGYEKFLSNWEKYALSAKSDAETYRKLKDKKLLSEEEKEQLKTAQRRYESGKFLARCELKFRKYISQLDDYILYVNSWNHKLLENGKK